MPHALLEPIDMLVRHLLPDLGLINGGCRGGGCRGGGSSPFFEEVVSSGNTGRPANNHIAEVLYDSRILK